jgi:hypothetical protein
MGIAGEMDDGRDPFIGVRVLVRSSVDDDESMLMDGFVRIMVKLGLSRCVVRVWRDEVKWGSRLSELLEGYSA